MPFYRVGLFCAWDAAVLTVTLLLLLLSVAPFRRGSSELTGPVGGRARRYRGDGFLLFVVVFDALALFLLRERGAEVGVELAIGRRRPGERPAHSSLELLQLRQRRSRNRPEHHVVIGQMGCDAIEAVRDRGAGRTSRRVIGPEHEMIDQQL